MRVLATICIVLTFAWAVGSKVVSSTAWVEFQESFTSWGVGSAQKRYLAAVAGVALDVIAALAPLVPSHRALGLLFSTLTLLAFAVALALRRRRTAVPCHCFGSISKGSSTNFHLSANVLMAGIGMLGVLNVWPVNSVGDYIFACFVGAVLACAAVFGGQVLGPDAQAQS